MRSLHWRAALMMRTTPQAPAISGRQLRVPQRRRQRRVARRRPELRAVGRDALGRRGIQFRSVVRSHRCVGFVVLACCLAHCIRYMRPLQRQNTPCYDITNMPMHGESLLDLSTVNDCMLTKYVVTCRSQHGHGARAARPGPAAGQSAASVARRQRRGACDSAPRQFCRERLRGRPGRNAAGPAHRAAGGAAAADADPAAAAAAGQQRPAGRGTVGHHYMHVSNEAYPSSQGCWPAPMRQWLRHLARLAHLDAVPVVLQSLP